MSYITPKEKEVLSLVAQGLSTKEIAGTLAISYHTVESHRKNLRLKFEARNSSELMIKVSRLAILFPEDRLVKKDLLINRVQGY